MHGQHVQSYTRGDLQPLYQHWTVKWCLCMNKPSHTEGATNKQHEDVKDPPSGCVLGCWWDSVSPAEAEEQLAGSSEPEPLTVCDWLMSEKAPKNLQNQKMMSLFCCVILLFHVLSPHSFCFPWASFLYWPTCNHDQNNELFKPRGFSPETWM